MLFRQAPIAVICLVLLISQSLRLELVFRLLTAGLTTPYSGSAACDRETKHRSHNEKRENQFFSAAFHGCFPSQI